MEELYGTLGVSREATPDEIKAAYRRAAMEHHPDRNIGSEDAAREKFQAVQNAYDVLSDPEKRAFYDQHGSAPGPKVDEWAALKEDAIQIFMEAVGTSGPNPSQWNLIDMMEQIIMGKQMTLRQAVQQNEALIAKLEKIVPRVGRKDGAPGPNVLSGFIEADVAAKREQNERTKQMIAHGEKLLEYVRTYTFEVEAPPPQPQWVNVTWGTSAGGTASTIS